MTSPPFEPMPITGVTINPDWPTVIQIESIDGARWMYRQNSTGDLELGRIYVTLNKDYTVTLFCPAAPYLMPSLLGVKAHADGS